MEEKSNHPIGCLEHEIYHNEQMKQEREISDARYADKLVQKIVYGAVGLMLISLVTAIIALVVR